MRQTYFAKTAEVQNKTWRHVDASGKRLGRLATEVAQVIMGKHRPTYTPHIDTGEFVIITNAEKIVMTGDKGNQKIKTRYTGHPGGLKSETYNQVLARRPELIVFDAVKRMVPKGRLGRQMMTKLRVFKGPDHPHQAQQPTPLDV